MLREIWLFEHELQARNFGQPRIFGGIKLINITVNRINKFHSHFQLKSNGKVEITSFSEQLSQRSKNNSQYSKNKLNTATDNGFYLK